MTRFNRRQFLQAGGSLVVASTIPGMLPSAFAADTVKLGLLHSLTGTIALAEASLVDAEKLAIEEINAAGGVMGKKIEAVIEDGASDWRPSPRKPRNFCSVTRWQPSSAATRRHRARRCCRC